jgi:hypothetical protein
MWEWGPLSTQPEDAVVVICGVRVPYVSRLKGDKFFFLGEAYYDSVMDGKIVDQR